MNFNSDTLLELLHEDLEGRDNDEITSFACEQLKITLFKKFVPKGSEAALQQAAIENFLDRNSKLATTLTIPSEHLYVFELWKDILHRIFLNGPYSTNIITLDACLMNAYAGPGTSRGAQFTDFVGKMFNSKLSSTSIGLYRHYTSNISARWKQAELIRSELHSIAVYKGSSLSAVPKDAKRCRTICTEPSLNMFYQLGAKFIIEDVLKRRYNIDVSKDKYDKSATAQPNINRNMARQGSIHGAFSTIDLKDASDSITMALLEYLLPKETLSVLNLIRSPNAHYRGKDYPLRMVSTMGNGFTFPLMTLLLTTLYHAFAISNSSRIINSVNFGCYGDDIIVPTAHYWQYCELLQTAGFIVNLDKSFAEGPFRESCGGDYYKGHDVRGIYIKRIEGESDVYASFNRLLTWCCKHNVYLPRVLHYLKGRAKFRPVPRHAGWDEGFIVPSSSVSLRSDCNGAYYYSALRPVPRRYRVRDSYINPFGALIGALGSYVRNNTVVVRPKARCNYRVEKCRTPHWDWTPDPELRNATRDFERMWCYILM
jgi:hypothetical protein